MTLALQTIGYAVVRHEWLGSAPLILDRRECATIPHYEKLPSLIQVRALPSAMADIAEADKTEVIRMIDELFNQFYAASNESMIAAGERDHQITISWRTNSFDPLSNPIPLALTSAVGALLLRHSTLASAIGTATSLALCRLRDYFAEAHALRKGSFDRISVLHAIGNNYTLLITHVNQLITLRLRALNQELVEVGAVSRLLANRALEREHASLIALQQYFQPLLEAH